MKIGRLTAAEFKRAARGRDWSEQTLEIGSGVLVEGKQQKEFCELYGISKAAVNQAVLRVWKAYLEMCVPEGFERVTVILPKDKAAKVKAWAEKAKQLIERVQ